MFVDQLMLRLVRLKANEPRNCRVEGLSFIFIKSGVCSCSFGVRPQRLSAGEMAVLNASTDWHLEAVGNQDAVLWSFSVVLDQLFPLFGVQEIPLLQNSGDLFKKLQVYAASNPLTVECRNMLDEVPPQFDVNHRCQLLRVAVAVLSAEFKNVQQGKAGYTGGEDHLIQVLENLSTDAILSQSVGELAVTFGCSRRHLNRLFHQHFGLSVASLRMEMRLLKAASLMRDPHAKIINVADQCGFNHLGLFNTCFKRRFGTSPGQWRKAMLHTEAPAKKRPANNFSCPVQTNGLCPLSGGPLSSGTAAARLPWLAQAPAASGLAEGNASCAGGLAAGDPSSKPPQQPLS